MLRALMIVLAALAACGNAPTAVPVDAGGYAASDARIVIEEAFAASGVSGAEEAAAAGGCRVLVVPHDAPRGETCGEWAGCADTECVIRARATDPCVALTALAHEVLHVAAAVGGLPAGHVMPLFPDDDFPDRALSAVYRAERAATARLCPDRLADVDLAFGL